MNNSIRAVIIENEDRAYAQLDSIIAENIKEINIVGRSKSVNTGIDLIKQEQPDIIFMDIELDDGSGFDILNELKSQNFEVIFTTAFDTYFEKAMQHFAFNYLLKPIDAEALRGVIDRYLKVKTRIFSEAKYEFLKEFLKEQNGQILLKVGFEHISVHLDTILRCEADGNYTKIFFIDKEPVLASFALKHYDGLLTNRGFFRANRSALINTKHLKSIYRRESIVLSDNSRVHVSQKNRESLITLIQRLT